MSYLSDRRGCSRSVKGYAAATPGRKTWRIARLPEGHGKAIQLMTKRGYRQLPIVDDKGELFGVISARDIVVYLAEHFPMEIYNRPPTRDQEQIFDSREGG